MRVVTAGHLKASRVGKRATTYPYSRRDNRVQLAAGGAIVVDEPLVVDENCISCAGPGHAVDVALLMLGLLLCPEASCKLSFGG